jgi:hypothetical protein
MIKTGLPIFAFNLIFLITLKAQEVPFKLKEEYETKIEVVFKAREVRSPNSVNLEGEQFSKGLISFLYIHFKILVSNGEKRIRIIHGRKDKIRKIEVNENIDLEMGFIEDLKSKESSGMVTLILLTEKKEPVSKVILSIEEDGTFLVNGVKRGKF